MEVKSTINIDVEGKWLHVGTSLPQKTLFGFGQLKEPFKPFCSLLHLIPGLLQCVEAVKAMWHTLE